MSTTDKIKNYLGLAADASEDDVLAAIPAPAEAPVANNEPEPEAPEAAPAEAPEQPVAEEPVVEQPVTEPSAPQVVSIPAGLTVSTETTFSTPDGDVVIPAGSKLTSGAVLVEAPEAAQAEEPEASEPEATEEAPEVETPVIPEGMILVDAASFEATQENARIAAADVAKRREDADKAIIEAAVKDGRFAPARRDHFVAAMKADPQGTRHLLTASAADGGLAPGTVPVEEIGDGRQVTASDTGNVNALFPQLVGKE